MAPAPINGPNNGHSNEMLSFRLGVQEFCIDIMTVREIRGWTPTTPLPRAPTFVRGVVNLRGVVLPILDLAECLGFGPTEPTTQHVIIVSQVGSQIAGLLVTAVCDIITVGDKAFQPPPDLVTEPAKACIKGFLIVEERMVGLLSLDQLLPELAEAA
jgi:purine-binding chemotaxis protein CheW